MSYCKHLSCYTPVNSAWSVASCAFHATPYVPSVQELELYCRSGRHQHCPVFFQSLPVEEIDVRAELEVVAIAQSL